MPEYWVADLTGRRIHRFRDTDSNATRPQVAWRDSAVFAVGQSISPLCMPELRIDVAAVLPDAGVER